jgi:hypothetical protein
MGTDKKGYGGKGKKTNKPKSPVDQFDPNLKKPIQLSLPLDLATVESFRKKHSQSVNT